MKPVVRLSIIASEMKPGQRYNVAAPDSRDILQVWPNPHWPEPDDDFATPHERMADWERRYGCRVTQYCDPPALMIEKLLTNDNSPERR